MPGSTTSKKVFLIFSTISSTDFNAPAFGYFAHLFEISFTSQG